MTQIPQRESLTSAQLLGCSRRDDRGVYKKGKGRHFFIPFSEFGELDFRVESEKSVLVCYTTLIMAENEYNLILNWR